MQPKNIILNIAVNLGRLGRWAAEGKPARIHQFIDDTESYLSQIRTASLSSQFVPTHKKFLQVFARLKKTPINDEWAEEAFTWANILTHRAKLA